MQSNNFRDFYQFAGHIIYAVVIGQSFVIASTVFIPIDKIFSFNGFANGFALFLAYTVIITGWVGWSKSVTTDPHSSNALGNFRFVTDLVILFLYYYLITLTDPENFQRYGETFIWVFPTVFSFYILWDLLKRAEYKSTSRTSKERKKRFIITIGFTLAFIVQSFIYQYVVVEQQYLTWDGNIVWNEVFIISSFVMTIAYRWLKWDVPIARKTRHKNNNNQ